MKIVKRYKGWKIKQTNKKDKEEGLTYEYYLYAPNEDDYPEYECDNLQEGIEFIDYWKEQQEIDTYKILKNYKDERVLVEWKREKDFFFPDGVEYSVHMLSLAGNLICGRYFKNKENAEEYYKKVTE